MEETDTGNKYQDGVSRELKDLRLVVDWGIGTLIPMTVLFIVTGIVSDSLTIFTVAFDYGLSLIVNIFAFAAIRIMMKKNVFTFPYGAGKLENFTSLLYGSLLMPTGCILIYTAVTRFFSPPGKIMFGVSQIPMGVSVVRSVALFMFTSWIIRRDRMQTSLMGSYKINYKISAVMDVSVMLALGLAMLLKSAGMQRTADFVDPVVTILLAGYMLVNGSRLIVRNFRALMDLPLPEEDQLRIMKALASEYDNYENIGQVFTRSSGNTRFIEIELVFDPLTDLSGIASIERRIRESLSGHFPDMRFRLIPVASSGDATWSR